MARYTVQDYLGELVNFGGVPMPRSGVMTWYQENGRTWQEADRWLAAYDQGQAIRHRASLLGWIERRIDRPVKRQCCCFLFTINCAACLAPPPVTQARRRRRR